MDEVIEILKVLNRINAINDYYITRNEYNGKINGIAIKINNDSAMASEMLYQSGIGEES